VTVILLDTSLASICFECTGPCLPNLVQVPVSNVLESNLATDNAIGTSADSLEHLPERWRPEAIGWLQPLYRGYSHRGLGRRRWRKRKGKQLGHRRSHP